MKWSKFLLLAVFAILAVTATAGRKGKHGGRGHRGKVVIDRLEFEDDRSLRGELSVTCYNGTFSNTTTVQVDTRKRDEMKMQRQLFADMAVEGTLRCTVAKAVNGELVELGRLNTTRAEGERRGQRQYLREQKELDGARHSRDGHRGRRDRESRTDLPEEEQDWTRWDAYDEALYDAETELAKLMGEDGLAALLLGGGDMDGELQGLHAQVHSWEAELFAEDPYQQILEVVNEMAASILGLELDESTSRWLYSMLEQVGDKLLHGASPAESMEESQLEWLLLSFLGEKAEPLLNLLLDSLEALQPQEAERELPAGMDAMETMMARAEAAEMLADQHLDYAKQVWAVLEARYNISPQTGAERMEMVQVPRPDDLDQLEEVTIADATRRARWYENEAYQLWAAAKQMWSDIELKQSMRDLGMHLQDSDYDRAEAKHQLMKSMEGYCVAMAMIQHNANATKQDFVSNSSTVTYELANQVEAGRDGRYTAAFNGGGAVKVWFEFEEHEGPDSAGCEGGGAALPIGAIVYLAMGVTTAAFISVLGYFMVKNRHFFVRPEDNLPSAGPVRAGGDPQDLMRSVAGQLAPGESQKVTMTIEQATIVENPAGELAIGREQAQPVITVVQQSGPCHDAPMSSPRDAASRPITPPSN